MEYQDEKELAEDRVVGCPARAQQHRNSAKKWRRRAIGIDVGVALLGALAGSALVFGLGGTTASILGVLAILAAALTAFRDALGPGKLAQEHQQAAITFSALGGSFRALVRAWKGDETSHQTFTELQREHQEAEKRGPDPEEWTR